MLDDCWSTILYEGGVIASVGLAPNVQQQKFINCDKIIERKSYLRKKRKENRTSRHASKPVGLTGPIIKPRVSRSCF